MSSAPRQNMMCKGCVHDHFQGRDCKYQEPGQVSYEAGAFFLFIMMSLSLDWTPCVGVVVVHFTTAATVALRIGRDGVNRECVFRNGLDRKMVCKRC